MTDKLYCYIRDNFNVSFEHLNTLEAIYNYMESNCHSLETAITDGYLVPCFWHDFVGVCEAGLIDLTEEELIDHSSGAIKRDEYYNCF